MTALRTRGFDFANSHALFPTFTTPNAAAIATGHYPGDTADFSNFLFAGFPVFDGRPTSSGKSPAPSLHSSRRTRCWATSTPTSRAATSSARRRCWPPAAGTASGPPAVGSSADPLIQDVTQGNPVNGAFAMPDTVVMRRHRLAGGLPLTPTVQAALQAAGLPLAPPPRTQPPGTT